MKKIFVLLLSLFLIPGFVKADEAKISYVKLPNIAYNLNVNGKMMSNGLTMFKLGDRVAYCIEPGVEINEKYYDVYTDWSKVNFSDELKALIEKIGYYGYEYPGHKDNYYYVAAQELIWKAINPNVSVSFTTLKDNGGTIIDVRRQKEEIMKLVQNHDLKPSFSEKLIKDEVNKTIVLEDENNVLENYLVSESKYHKILKEGNKLTITLNEKVVPEEVLTLTRKHYDEAPLLIYSKGNSQKLASLRISTDKDSFIKLANEEALEEVEVPNTALYDGSSLISLMLLGFGLALFKVR